MNKKVGNILKYGLSILLAVALLYFAFRKVDWKDFWAALRACRWEYVLLSVFFGLLTFYLRALRWREILLPIDPSTRTLSCFNGVNIGYAVNMVLPRVGEVLRCTYITAHSKKVTDPQTGEDRRLASFDKVIGTAVLERTVDVIIMLAVLVVFLPFTWDKYGGFFVEKIFGAASGGVTFRKVIILVLVLLALAVSAWVVIRFSERWKPLGKIKDFCKGIWQGFVSCLRMKRAWWFFLLTLLIWVCYWMMSATILWAVQGIDTAAVPDALASAVSLTQNMNMADALFLMLAGALSSVVPVPGGFGAFHFIVAGAISYVYGLPFEFGIIFATLSHESQELNQLVWGGISFIIEQFRKD
ncbi:MAG: flippase-like domain-containing protein [Bacteroidales bacterium]|nr:flippase-like domain-containing protein [Bacteroidales bacterium]